jgi:hypothetical protein
MDINFFAKFVLMERERPSNMICQVDVVHNLPTKLPQKLLDEIAFIFCLTFLFNP